MKNTRLTHGASMNAVTDVFRNAFPVVRNQEQDDYGERQEPELPVVPFKAGEKKVVVMGRVPNFRWRVESELSEQST